MKKPKSQSDRILAHLLSGKSLNALQARDKFGVMRLAARIKNLRDNPYRDYWVNTDMKTVNGKRIAVYRIVR